MPSLEQLNKMLHRDPTDSFLLYAIAQEHFKNRAYGDAVGFYNRAIAEDPDHAYSYFHKARALEEQGLEMDAIETLEKGLEAARGSGDQQAVGEIMGYLDQLR